METLNITREQVNEAIGKFADVFLNDLGVAIADDETTEPELTGTQFKAIDSNGVERVMDAEYINWGTLVVVGICEYFRSNGVGDKRHPWVSYSGTSYTNERFAARMRAADNIPRIVHEG